MALANSDTGIHPSGIQYASRIKGLFQALMELLQWGRQRMEDLGICCVLPKPGGMSAGCRYRVPDACGAR